MGEEDLTIWSFSYLSSYNIMSCQEYQSSHRIQHYVTERRASAGDKGLVPFVGKGVKGGKKPCRKICTAAGKHGPQEKNSQDAKGRQMGILADHDIDDFHTIVRQARIFGNNFGGTVSGCQG